MAASLSEEQIRQLVKAEVENQSQTLSLDLATRLVDLAKSETADSAAVRVACDGIAPSAAAVLISIFVPSKKKGKSIPQKEQQTWRFLAMAVLGASFKGCTSIGGSHIGLWAESPDEEAEESHIVQAYAAIEELQKATTQERLGHFMYSMCSMLEQAATLLVIGGRRFLFRKSDVPAGKAIPSDSDLQDGISNFKTLEAKIAEAFEQANTNYLERFRRLLEDRDNDKKTAALESTGLQAGRLNNETTA